MTTIKECTAAKAEIRANAKAELDELERRKEQVRAQRDQDLQYWTNLAEEIRAERNAKLATNKAKRDDKAKAKEEILNKLRREAWAAAAAKAKQAMAQAHPDKGGTNDGFRAAYAMWKVLEAHAKAI